LWQNSLGQPGQAPCEPLICRACSSWKRGAAIAHQRFATDRAASVVLAAIRRLISRRWLRRSSGPVVLK
jgi:hypothetical protein